MFPINAAALPLVPTRKALLIIDLQNDFVSPDGALPTTEPDGFVPRTLELAKAFRNSGAGDVIWVRTEFEHHRSLAADGDQVVVSSLPIRPNHARGRRPTSRAHLDAALENDDEAFLSVPPGCDKPSCCRKGTPGAELAPAVQDAVVADRDIVFTKTHYSAFASGQLQLVQLLRGRFVTEMYICGALTNVSIHATAIDAAKYGYDMTIVENCCGFRNSIRHTNALQQLVDLTGSDVATAEEVREKLEAPKREKAAGSRSRWVDADQEPSLRPPASKIQSTGLSPTVSRMSLTRGGASPAGSSMPQSEELTGGEAAPTQSGQQTFKPVVVARSGSEGRAKSVKRGGPSVVTDAPLEAQDTTEAVASDERESLGPMSEARRRRAEAAQLKMEAASNQTDAGLPRKQARHPSASTDANAEQVRIKSKIRRRIKPGDSVDKTSAAQQPQPAPKEPSELKQQDPAAVVTSQPNPAAAKMAEQQQAISPTVSEPFCEGDTHVISNVLPAVLGDSAFERLLSEVSWAGMSHLGGEVPRRIAVQGSVDDEGNMPVYRHPADESPPLLPFSPTVLAIKTEIEKHLGHPLNHVLIQHYRTGNDYISEHSDKTLDIVRGSFIANVSLGAERTMVFRTKRPSKDKEKDTPATKKKANDSDGESASEKAKRQVQRAPLPHNSLCRMGLATNMRWLHAIRQDKRAERDKTAAERAYGGARISLTFRHIGTFLDAPQVRIWGQGATAKTRDTARPVTNGQTSDAVRMLQAFGAENHSSDFNWEVAYGAGFDVLHMGTPKRFCAGTGDGVANARVALALAELGISCARGSVEGDVRFEDNDTARTSVDGHDTVLRYLDAVYGAGRRYDQMLAGEVARRFVRLQEGLDLLGKWRAAQEQAVGEEEQARKNSKLARLMKKDLTEWEGYAAEAAASATAATTAVDTAGEDGAAAPEARKGDMESGLFYIVGGSQPSPADFALWPVLHDMVRECGEGFLQGECLKQYYQAFGKRSAVGKILGTTGVAERE